jgi:predicted dinucleotide-binding enzyme
VLTKVATANIVTANKQAMHIKETIVLIGSGNNGRLAAGALLAGSYKLLLCDKKFELARELARELDSDNSCAVEAMECSFDCAWEADVILLASDFEEQLESVRIIKDVINQKILISLGDNVHCNSDYEVVSPNRQIALLQQILPNTKIAVVRLAAANWDNGLQTNIIEHIAVFGREQNTVDTAAEIFKHSGIVSLKKELMPLTGNTSQTVIIGQKMLK